MNYDTWKATNPDDEFLGPEPEDDPYGRDENAHLKARFTGTEWRIDDTDELPADWPPMDDDPQSMTGEADE